MVKLNTETFKFVEANGRCDVTHGGGEVTWVFYRSPATGKIGASDELLLQLKNAGIKTTVAGDLPKDIIDKAIIKYAPTIK